METEAAACLTTLPRDRRSFWRWLAALLVLGAASWAADTSAVRSLVDAPTDDENRAFVFSLLPKALQRAPALDFNIITEMTAEGRKLNPPTPDHPAYYVQQAGLLAEMGADPLRNQKAPRVADLEHAMQKALAGSSYLPTTPAQTPSLVVVFNYGSHGADPQLAPEIEDLTRPQPVTAEERLPIVLADSRRQRDLLERAALVGGMKFALELREALEHELIAAEKSPNPASPYQMFISGKNRDLVSHLVEDAFHDCYFVIASAYDYADLSRGRKRLLWRTKMTVDAQGVNMTETLQPLIASAAPYFGKDMSEAAVVSKRLSREGRVEIGTATVVDDDAATAKPGETTPDSRGKK